MKPFLIFYISLVLFLSSLAILTSCSVNQPPLTIKDVNNSIHLDASINNHTFYFNVDSGASFVDFPASDASLLNQPTPDFTDPSNIGVENDMANGASVAAIPFIIPKMQVGNCILTNVLATLVNTPMPEPLFGLSAINLLNITITKNKMTIACLPQTQTTN